MMITSTCYSPDLVHTIETIFGDPYLFNAGMCSVSCPEYGTGTCLLEQSQHDECCTKIRLLVHTGWTHQRSRTPRLEASLQQL